MTDERFTHDLDRVSWRNLGDDVAVFDVIDGEIRVLTGSAAVLWRSMGSPMTTRGLVAALQDEFDVPDDIAADDVSAFLHESVRLGMVRRVIEEEQR